MTPPERQRPSAVSEIRAWIGVGVVLVMHAVGGVWWAATLSAEMRALRDVVAKLELQIAGTYTGAEAARALADIHKQLNDHELRLRNVERAK
jgi:uncharacterized protein (DUF2342 family)